MAWADTTANGSYDKGEAGGSFPIATGSSPASLYSFQGDNSSADITLSAPTPTSTTGASAAVLTRIGSADLATVYLGQDFGSDYPVTTGAFGLFVNVTVTFWRASADDLADNQLVASIDYGTQPSAPYATNTTRSTFYDNVSYTPIAAGTDREWVTAYVQFSLPSTATNIGRISLGQQGHGFTTFLYSVSVLLIPNAG